MQRKAPQDVVFRDHSSSAHIYTSLLASDAVSAGLSNSTRMSSCQSSGREAPATAAASTAPVPAPAPYLPLLRTGSMPNLHHLPVSTSSTAHPPRNERSHSSDHSAAPRRGTRAAAAAAAAAAATAPMPRPWGFLRRASDELGATEAAAAAAALRVHTRSHRSSRRSSSRSTGRTQPVFTNTNAIYEPDSRPTSPPSDEQAIGLLPFPSSPQIGLPSLDQHRQESHGSRASWKAPRFVPSEPPAATRPQPTAPAFPWEPVIGEQVRAEPRSRSRTRTPPRRERVSESGFPREPGPPTPLPLHRLPGASTESGVTPCTASGVGDTSYDVTVRVSLPAHASLRARLDFIEYQLDAFRAGSMVLGEFEMPGPGPGNRFKGGAAHSMDHHVRNTRYTSGGIRGCSAKAHGRLSAALWRLGCEGTACLQ